MTDFIVITSIFEPTEAVRRFARFPEHRLVVVGDRKTPPDWRCDGAVYLSPASQQGLGFRLHAHLPYDHYCRKMLGYLYALAGGATRIVDTDDDNVPEPGWGFPPFSGTYPTVPDGLGFVNVYELYTDQRIWPRGHPLRLVTRERTIPAGQLVPRESRVGVWQGLADGDPDVDAVYRLTSDAPCLFRKSGPHVLGPGTVVPFNSQNTAVRRELAELLYLPVSVTFRFTDILRGLVAQPILWLHGYSLGFTDATVTQERNPHDYLRDFESEVPMYLHAEKAVDLVAAALAPGRSLGDDLRAAYEALCRARIVAPGELDALDAWLADCRAACAGGA